MSKTRFGSQEVILDGFKTKKLEKKTNGTRGPPPFNGKSPLFLGSPPLAAQQHKFQILHSFWYRGTWAS